MHLHEAGEQAGVREVVDGEETLGRKQYWFHTGNVKRKHQMQSPEAIYLTLTIGLSQLDNWTLSYLENMNAGEKIPEDFPEDPRAAAHHWKQYCTKV